MVTIKEEEKYPMRPIFFVCTIRFILYIYIYIYIYAYSDYTDQLFRLDKAKLSQNVHNGGK